MKRLAIAIIFFLTVGCSYKIHTRCFADAEAAIWHVQYIKLKCDSVKVDTLSVDSVGDMWLKVIKVR